MTLWIASATTSAKDLLLNVPCLDTLTCCIRDASQSVQMVKNRRGASLSLALALLALRFTGPVVMGGGDCI